MKTSRVLVIVLLFILSCICTPAQKRAPKPVDMPASLVSDRLPETRASEDAQPGPGGDPNSLITATSYPMTVLGGWPLEDMSGAIQLIAPSTDNDTSGLAPIGFTFRFDNANFTTFSVNGNGFLHFGVALGPGGQTNNLMTASVPRAAPFWDNLCVGSNGQVHYKTIGAPGMRKLVVEWQNMQITRNGACSGAGGGTFQLWLLENIGVIQFVYGNGMVATAAVDSGYSIGLQSGTSGNFASVTAASNTVSYAAANNTQTTAIPTGTSYVFAPPVPPPPSSGNVTAVTSSTLQLNWTDNASTETSYFVRRSTDNINFTDIATPPANSVNYADTGLAPGTQYFYRVSALSEGAFGQEISLSGTTNPGGNISSTGAGGMWSSPGTWAGGLVPGGGDNVTIADGSTVTIDTAAAALTLTVGSTGALAELFEQLGSGPATLTFEETTARSLTVGGNVLIKSNGIFATFGLGNVTGHVLSLGGSLTNNGGLDFSTNNNQAGADIIFTGASNNTFGGTGAVTDIRTITVNKGTTRDNILELSPANFTVQGSTGESPGSGFLTLTNGTFKISGSFTGGHRTFADANYFIPNSCGIWLNNPNYSITGQNGTANVNGIFRVTSGTYNVGTATDNSVGFGLNSAVTIEGGAVNTTGRFGVFASTVVWSYTQTGGAVTTCTIGHSSSTAGCFDMGSATASAVTITAGEITIQNGRSSFSNSPDYRHQGGTTGPATVTGGTVRFGNASTTSGVTFFYAAGVMPNLVIDNTVGGHTLLLHPGGVFQNVTRNVTINTGTTFNINGSTPYLMNGSTFVNNGTLTALQPSTANFVWFDPAGNPTYSGTGVSAGIIGSFTVQGQSLTLDPAVNNIRVRNLNVFSGNIINANKLTLGNNDSIVSVIQFGNTTTPTPAGTLDTAPVFNLGTGGQTLRYLRTGNIRTVGPELNPTRTLVGLTYDNNDPATDELNITGGDLTVTGAMLLTNGEIKMGANKLTHNGAATRVNGYVNGMLSRTYTAQQSHYIYHVGSNGYSPAFFFMGFLDINPSNISVKPVDAVLPDLDPAISGTRHWEVVETGNVNGRWEFTYTDADVVSDESTYQVWGQHGSARPILEGQSNNPATNTVMSGQPLSDIGGKWGFGHFAQLRAFGGTVYTFNFQPIRNATVILSGGGLPAPRVTQTGSLGNYFFDDVLTGTTYTLFVSAKRFRFSPITRDVIISGDINTPINVIANPQ